MYNFLLRVKKYSTIYIYITFYYSFTFKYLSNILFVLLPQIQECNEIYHNQGGDGTIHCRILRVKFGPDRMEVDFIRWHVKGCRKQSPGGIGAATDCLIKG